MKIKILNNKVSFTSEGDIFHVNDDFFDGYPLPISDYSVKIIDGNIVLSYDQPAETPEQQKARVKQSLISTPDLSSVDLEGVTFSDTEIGDIIQARVFGGNPHAEAALQAKTSVYLLSVISGEPNEELGQEILDKKSQVNQVRNKFGLSEI